MLFFGLSWLCNSRAQVRIERFTWVREMWNKNVYFKISRIGPAARGRVENYCERTLKICIFTFLILNLNFSANARNNSRKSVSFAYLEETWKLLEIRVDVLALLFLWRSEKHEKLFELQLEFVW